MNEHVEVIPTKPNLPYPLGRYGVNHDRRNADHLALVAPPPRSATPYRSWATSVVFDQGDTSRCTCEAAVGLLRTAPFNAKFTEKLAYDEPAERQALYLEAQQNDPWPGPPPAYDGSSTDAPFKVMRARGSITSWKWLMGEAQTREYLTWYGPLVVGVLWYDGMFYPDGQGFLNPTGDVAGGHAFRLVQYSKARDAYRVVNSWGRSWGQAGRAWLRSSVLADLLAQDGDSVTIGV